MQSVYDACLAVCAARAVRYVSGVSHIRGPKDTSSCLAEFCLHVQWPGKRSLSGGLHCSGLMNVVCYTLEAKRGTAARLVPVLTSGLEKFECLNVDA